jgi:hypothetical protein
MRKSNGCRKLNMQMKSPLTIRTYFCFVLYCGFLSCTGRTDPLTQRQSDEARERVQKMMDMVSRDVSRDGPIAWLTYFENTPGFFMVSEGQLVFPNGEIASTVIKNDLVKQIRDIELHWSNVRIDILTETFANVGAAWNEEITDSANHIISQNGYFTAVAEKTRQGWKLRNAHWSVTKQN